MASSHDFTARVYFVVLLALMGLTALTVWAAYQDFGRFNDLVALGIAGLKASLVVWFFMHLKFATRLTRIGIMSGILFMLILFAFVLADVDTRGLLGVPGK